MFLALKRFILLPFKMKKHLILLFVITLTFCLMVIMSTSFFTHFKKYLGWPSYRRNKSSALHLSAGTNFPQSSLSHNYLVSGVDSLTNRQITSPLKTCFNNWTVRPWFLTNGSLRLSPLEASKLALWPEESDPYNDRIVNQLMYIPMNYNEKEVPIKTIHLSAGDSDWKLSLGSKEFSNCPVSSCHLVSRKFANNADLILFKSQVFEIFLRNRKPDQIWAKYEIESPENIYLEAPSYSINWTLTYRHDSEIPVPYFKYYPYENSTRINNTHNYAANKIYKVAWFVSNCMATNARLEYANELAKYIPVHIYGRCGTYKCSKDDSQCWELLNTHYKFYLSFENSNCLDYITEKFWSNGLKHDIIPIVMGAHPSTYKQLAPPHSHIHVDDFETPKQLAEYLHLLDSNDHLYNQYFEWKGKGEIKEVYMWCRICALLHAPRSTRAYLDLSSWWSSNTCVPLSWTNMTLGDTVFEPNLNQRSIDQLNHFFYK